MPVKIPSISSQFPSSSWAGLRWLGESISGWFPPILWSSSAVRPALLHLISGYLYHMSHVPIHSLYPEISTPTTSSQMDHRLGITPPHRHPTWPHRDIWTTAAGACTTNHHRTVGVKSLVTYMFFEGYGDCTECCFGRADSRSGWFFVNISQGFSVGEIWWAHW